MVNFVCTLLKPEAKQSYRQEHQTLEKVFYYMAEREALFAAKKKV